MIKYKSIIDNKLAIFNNILINNGSVTAYYVLYPYAYSIMDLASAERHVSRLYNALSNLHHSFGEVKMSMFQLKNIVSREETIASIINTVRMYKKDYKDFPPEYRKFIKNITRDFSILAITIDIKNSIDIESQTFRGVIKDIVDNFVKTNFSANVANVDEDAVRMQNVRIKNTLARYAVPANPKLVMNIYINSLFPSYNLVYNSYLLDNNSAILGGVHQEFIPHLGWFEMSNSGIVEFGGTPRTTYGSVLTVLQFPEYVMSENFNINVPGLHVNMHLMPKDKALLKFKRMRADVSEELEEADAANTTDTDVDEDLSLAELALKYIRKGRIATEVDANILVVADSKEELDAKKKHVISVMSDINVVCSIAGNQAKTYVNSFVKNRPQSYYHVMDLEYALSFQLDSGILCGDQDSKFAAPVVGVSY